MDHMESNDLFEKKNMGLEQVDHALPSYLILWKRLRKPLTEVRKKMFYT